LSARHTRASFMKDELHTSAMETNYFGSGWPIAKKGNAALVLTSISLLVRFFVISINNVLCRLGGGKGLTIKY